jgi:hypothetical protein
MKLLNGAIDFHVHSYPDVRQRKLDDIGLVEEAKAAGLRALLLKSHVFSTAERAYLLNRIYPTFKVFGGIVLNHTVGGLNPLAVEAALKMGAINVWMPTQSAANHQRRLGGNGSLTIFSTDGTILPAVINIIQQIAASDAILATGHLSPEESIALSHEAVKRGVKRVVITHPEWGATAVSVEAQQELAATGHVYFDRCLVSTTTDLHFNVTFEFIVDQIRAVGVETTIFSTDFGTPQNPTPVEGMKIIVEKLLKAGFSETEVEIMVKKNPAKLLKLDQ